MNKTVFTKIGLIIGIFVVLASGAEAQTAYRADIPFDFNIGDRAYKSGIYLLSKLSAVSDSKVMVLRDRHGRRSRAMVPTNNHSEAGSATLTFRRYADRYFLSDVKAWQVGVEFSISKMEEMLAKETQAERQTIALSMAK